MLLPVPSPQTDLPTPRPDYFPDPEPILSEAEKALKDLHKVLGPRMDQVIKSHVAALALIGHANWYLRDAGGPHDHVITPFFIC